MTVVGVLPADMAEELRRPHPLLQSLLELPTSCSQVGGGRAAYLLLTGQWGMKRWGQRMFLYLLLPVGDGQGRHWGKDVTCLVKDVTGVRTSPG